MHITFIGYGHVGARLADHLQRLGHAVSLLVHDKTSETLKEALALNPKLKAEDNPKTIEQADVVFLAVPFPSAEKALQPLRNFLKGKIVVDCTNPVGPNLSHGLNSKQSGSEFLQSSVIPESSVVKAFTIYGYENFSFEQRKNTGEGNAAMLYCGNDQKAKEVVAKLIAALEWKPVDVGKLDTALHLEHMTLLWIKMVRVQGNANFLWSLTSTGK